MTIDDGPQPMRRIEWRDGRAVVAVPGIVGLVDLRLCPSWHMEDYWDELLDEIERLRALATEILDAYEEDTPCLSAMERFAAECREKLAT